MGDSAPFVFACHQCGHCCKTGHGRVWIGADDLAPLAAARGEDPRAFTRRHVVQVGARLSLRERADGSCVLLEDGHHCTAYAARPAQCRSFPFWPEILAGGPALEQAAGMCPGMQRIPPPELAAAVLPRAAALLAAETPPPPGPATPWERWGCTLEADLALAGVVVARLTDPEAAEARRRALEDLAASSGYPWSVGPWERLCAERRRGWLELRGALPRLESAA